MTKIPSVRYTKSGGFSLAYQVTGAGPKDMIYLPFETANVVGNWFVPEHARFMERLASFTRLVITDRRGMGCSDRLPPGVAPTLEELVDDLLVVMEVAYASPATVFAGNETAFIALLAAATHPDRVGSLVLWGASPSWRRSEELPWEASDDAIEADLGTIQRITDLRAWADRFVRDAVPSWAGDPERVALIEAMSALSGSAEAWHQDQRMFHGVDLRELIGSIRVPILLMANATSLVHAESSRFLADHMPDAKLIEFDGRDGFPWLGDADAVLAEIETFINGQRVAPDANRLLVSVLFTDVVDSTRWASDLGDAAWIELLDRHHEVTRAALARFGGREVDTAGDGFLATFDGPARAVRCAKAITEGVAAMGIQVRAGVHVGEIERAGSDVRGIAVHIGARVAGLAEASEVLVSSTVRDLTAGSGLTFEDAGEHELKGVPDRWRLFRVVG